MSDEKDTALTEEEVKARNAEVMADLDTAHAEAAETEREGLVLDFDEALTDYKRQAVSLDIKFEGQTYQIPSTTPASFAMFYLRHCLTKTEAGYKFDIPEERFIEFLNLMFGEDLATRLTSGSTEMGFIINALIPKVLMAWGMEFTRTGADSGKAKAAAATLD